MEKPCTMSHDVTIGRLLGQTFGYIGQNWKPLLVLFGLTYLAVEIASWGVGEFMGASSGQTSSFVMMVPALLLEAICLPFVVDDRPFFLSQWSASYNNQDGKKDTSTIQRVFSWLFLRNLSLVIFLVMGYFLAQSSLPFFLFVGVLVCWLLLIFWVFIRLCFLGPLLACGDAVKGGLAIKISWESVKGLVCL